jgi:predicted amidohydrolase YtcJ
MTGTCIRNARLYLGAGRWESGSLFVRDGRIAARGVDGAIAQLCDDATEIVDARGASVLPGFHDTHTHPVLGGIALLGIDLTPVHDADAYHRLIRDHAAAHPELEVVEGSGWYGDVYPGGGPTRWMLDELVPDRPAILTSHDAHGVWVNSAALAAAGVADDIPDPPGGRFVRDGEGRLTGLLLDAAQAAIAGIRPAARAGLVEDGIRAAQERLHAVGITSWHDAAVGPSELGPDSFDAYLALDASGELRTRVALCQWWDRERGLEQIAGFEERRERVRSTRWLRARIVKVMQDGVIENRTAAMLEPYRDDPGNRGESFIEPARLNELVAALDARGFDVHLHAVGDRAVRECLDAVQHAREVNGPSGGRHQIAHVDIVAPDDLPRFAALDVTANVQMLWARLDAEVVERKLPGISADAARSHFPFGSLLAHGARLAGGSDWPVSDPNPLWAIHTGATRLAPSTDPHATPLSLTEPMLPGEAIPVGAGLDAYTGDAAWVGRLENETGVLAAGFAADLVILDRDISGGEGLDVANVVATYLEGERL